MRNPWDAADEGVVSTRGGVKLYGQYVATGIDYTVVDNGIDNFNTNDLTNRIVAYRREGKTDAWISNLLSNEDMNGWKGSRWPAAQINEAFRRANGASVSSSNSKLLIVGAVAIGAYFLFFRKGRR